MVLEIGSEGEEEREGRKERIEEITRKELIEVVKGSLKGRKHQGKRDRKRSMEIYDKRDWRRILEIS